MRRMRHIKAREFQGCDIAYDFSNPASLYDATSGGSLVAADGAIARANDLSGGSGHMTQGTSENRPLRKVAALNGRDVARFDGSNDYLTAGDVGDMLDKPFEAFAVVYRTGSAAVQGFFGKSRAAGTAGRLALLRNTDDACIGDTSGTATATEVNASVATVSVPQFIALTHNRSTSTNGAQLTLRRNGNQVANGTAYTDTATSRDTSDITLIGAYQNSTGNGVLASSYFAGDFGECAKYSVFFGPAQRLRLELSRCRKWGIKS